MKLDAAIAKMQYQGCKDLAAYREGLARVTGSTLEQVDAAIVAAGPARVVDPETVAQERMAEDRRLRHHEEE